MEIAGYTAREEQHALESLRYVYVFLALILSFSAQFHVIEKGVVHGTYSLRGFSPCFVAEWLQIDPVELSFAVRVHNHSPFVQQLHLKFLLMTPLFRSHITCFVAPTQTAAAPLQLNGKAIVVVEGGL